MFAYAKKYAIDTIWIVYPYSKDSEQTHQEFLEGLFKNFPPYYFDSEKTIRLDIKFFDIAEEQIY